MVAGALNQARFANWLTARPLFLCILAASFLHAREEIILAKKNRGTLSKQYITQILSTAYCFNAQLFKGCSSSAAFLLLCCCFLHFVILLNHTKAARYISWNLSNVSGEKRKRKIGELGGVTLRKCSIYVSGRGLILVKQRVVWAQRKPKYPVVLMQWWAK